MIDLDALKPQRRVHRKHPDGTQRGGPGTQQKAPLRPVESIPRGAVTDEYEPRSKHGVTCWENAKNGFFVIRVHRSAHPEKRDERWVKAERAKNPALFDREEEIDFRSRKGVRVFGDFNWNLTERDIGDRYSSQSMVIRPFVIPKWWPLWTTTDPGRTAAWSTNLVAIDENGVWFVIGELVKTGLDYRPAKRLIHTLLLRGRKTVENVIDVDATKRRVESVNTLLELMAKQPFALECVAATRRANDFVALQEYRDRLAKRPDGYFGVYFFAVCRETIEAHRTAVYDKGDALLSGGIDPVDGMKYLSTHMTDRAIRPKKPERYMTSSERMAKRLWGDRARAEKAARLAQRRRDLGIVNEGLESW